MRISREQTLFLMQTIQDMNDNGERVSPGNLREALNQEFQRRKEEYLNAKDASPTVSIFRKAIWKASPLGNRSLTTDFRHMGPSALYLTLIDQNHGKTFGLKENIPFFRNREVEPNISSDDGSTPIDYVLTEQAKEILRTAMHQEPQ